MQAYFPQGIATDEAFCNREAERLALKNSIERHEHVVLIGPRRYGKTSLIMKVLKENDFPGVNIDFFFALTQAEVTKTLADGISKIITQLLPKTALARKKLIDSITALNPKLSFNVLGQKIEISTHQHTEKSITELLLALDQFAQKAGKSCVVALDEFQQIGELKENHAVEAAIRHAVERSKRVSYIFCGSKRHLLNEMFSDKARPLYHLCDLMQIERISAACYQSFLKQKAQKQWKQTLTEDTLEEITHLTENHPYYMNALCRRLWRYTKMPGIVEVRNTWEEYIAQQSEWIVNDLSYLTLNRRKVMAALAYEPAIEIQGQAFSKRVGLNPSGIKKCLVDLQKLDMVQVDKAGYYRVLDPAIAYFIRKNLLPC